MKKIGIVLIIFLLATSINQGFNKQWEREVFTYDACGYYLYLPAVFDYHDLGKLDFYAHLDTTIRPTRDYKWYGIHYQENTGRRVNKYPPGLAIAELPFYLGARLYESFGVRTDPYGFGKPYKVAISIAPIVWSTLGLLVLGLFLKRLWGENTAAITLLLIGLGTNLYTYTVTDAGLSHPFNFLLFAALLWLTLQWHTSYRPRYLYGLAVVCGWIFLCRPPNVFIFMIPVVWGIYNRAALLEKWKRLQQQWPHLLGALLVFMAVCSINFMYWKYTTGEFLHYSYEGEGFDFCSPQLYNGLFSWEKGWFLYTPLAAFGFIGLVQLFRKQKMLAVWVALYFVIVLYFTFSWICWHYGWTFSCRPLIESLTVLSIPLAAFVQMILRQKWPLKLLITAIGGFLIWLNIYQSNQYITQALPGNGISREYYFRVWNRMHTNDEDRKLLPF